MSERQQQSNRTNSSLPLKISSQVQKVNMPPPATSGTDYCEYSTENPRHSSTAITTSNNTMDRCFFLLIHFFFYLIILIIVYIHLGQFNRKHEQILATLNSNHNLTHSSDRDSMDCSCQTIPYPRRNRTTRCLELRVGLTDMLSDVFCPVSGHEHEHNQWLTIQDRQTNDIDFNRTWMEYRRGFGDLINEKDFWIGNENLYWLTNHYQCRLRIELTDWHNDTRIGTYELFHISHQRDDYRLHIGGYHGNIEIARRIDSFSRWHSNAPFSTYDHYATDGVNCPHLYGGGGWWYHLGADCAHVQLNGILASHSDGLVPLNTGILWIGWKGDRHYSFQRVRMSIQPKLKRDRSYS